MFNKMKWFFIGVFFVVIWPQTEVHIFELYFYQPNAFIHFSRPQAKPSLLDRVLDVNALIGSGNNNKGDGVEENQVHGSQKYWHNIYNLERKKDN